MAGNREYRDFFSQGSSSNPVWSVDEEDYGFGTTTQASDGGAGASNFGFSGLDLNSQASGYPDLEAYRRILQPDNGSGHSFPPPAPRSRSAGAVPYRPPRMGGPPAVQGGGRRKGPVSQGGSGGGGSLGHGGGGSLGHGGGGSLGRSGGRPARSGGTAGLRGSMGHGGSRRATSSASRPVTEVDEEDDLDDEDECVNQPRRPIDKAEWTPEHTFKLCEIAVEEIQAGNCPNGIWSNTGYKNIRNQYFAKVGLWHNGKQLKNRIGQLKGLYSAWIWLQQQTGCGIGPNGEITATPDWWRKAAKEKPDAKKLRNGPPLYMDMLHDMFHSVVVDGSSAWVPGTDEPIQAEEDEDENEEGFLSSPLSSNTRKRGSSSCDLNSTGTSPPKKSSSKASYQSNRALKTKNPVMKIMNMTSGIVESNEKSLNLLQELVDQGKSQERAKTKLKDEITNCLRLAVECGAHEESIEHYMATKLFMQEGNRIVFETMSSNEARFTWLQRNCQERRMYQQASQPDA